MGKTIRIFAANKLNIPAGLFLLFTGLYIFTDFSTARDLAGGKNILSLFAAGAATSGLFLMSREKPLLSFLPPAILYITINASLLFSSMLITHDSFNFHYPVFAYIADYINIRHSAPDIFPSAGGLPIGMFHINLFPFSPFRIAGYLLHVVLGIDTIFCYKAQFIAGILTTTLGWWLVLLRISPGIYPAYFAILGILLGGSGITMHQEQALMTFHLAPWFALCLIKTKEDIRFLSAAATLFALGSSTHYPQIQLIGMGTILLTAVIAGQSHLKKIFAQAKIISPSAIAVLLAIAAIAIMPSLYIKNRIADFSSQMRIGSAIEPRSYEEYLTLNKDQQSSASQPMLTNYISIKGSHPDNLSFFIGKLGIIAAAAAVIFAFKESLIFLVPATFFLLLCLGIHSPLPEWLFRLHFPFIAPFRQWIHFFPFANMALSALAALGMTCIYKKLSRLPHRSFKILLIVLVAAHASDLAYEAISYINLYKTTSAPANITTQMYAVYNPEGPARILQYKDRNKLVREAPSMIPGKPVYTHKFIIGKGDEQDINILKSKNTGLEHLPVIATTTARVREFNTTAKVKNTDLLETAQLSSGVLYIYPFNYGLPWQVFIDGKKTDTFKANYALTAFFVPAGKHSVAIEAARDYNYLVPAALILLIFATLLCAGLYYTVSKGKPQNP